MTESSPTSESQSSRDLTSPDAAPRHDSTDPPTVSDTRPASSLSPSTDGASVGISATTEAELNRVITKFGGRHLIFRTQVETWHWLPRPYALISDFSGPVWFFYGLGQIWITHKKYKEYDGWTARVPRIGNQKVIQMIDFLEEPITHFTHYCNEQGIEGTMVVEPGVIEFHWTFGYSLAQEKLKPEQSNSLEAQFSQLTDAFVAAKLELRM